MSYRVDKLRDGTSFDAGTSLLFAGPSTATDEQLLDAVTPDEGERAIVITTDLGGEQTVTELQRRGADRNQLGIIDCTGGTKEIEGVPVRRLGSPGDLTGISLEFAKLLDDDMTVRVGFASVSTVLMYAELRTVFRFLHVFTARIRSGEMFGCFSIDPSMHEGKDLNTIRSVFDCLAETDGEETTLKGVGFQQ